MFEKNQDIYELRKKRGWSQSDLTRKLDKKASMISSYETDSKTLSVDTIIAMSELFGVSIDELIYGENAEVLSTKHCNKSATAHFCSAARCLIESASAFSP